jgi:hypothetical protein
VGKFSLFVFVLKAVWSSPVACQAHTQKVAGPNPAPATNTSTGDMSNRIIWEGSLRGNEKACRPGGMWCPRRSERGRGLLGWSGAPR